MARRRRGPREPNRGAVRAGVRDPPTYDGYDGSAAAVPPSPLPVSLRRGGGRRLVAPAEQWRSQPESALNQGINLKVGLFLVLPTPDSLNGSPADR
eukprot:SAG31_NODE_7684_length_1615_cov_4.183136_2_plen_96_part_00